MAIVSFGPKTAWIAARGATPEAVIAALSLRDVRRVPWGEGIEASYRTDDRIVFVTPSVDGWVFAVGWALMDQAEEDAAWLGSVPLTQSAHEASRSWMTAH